jgi:transposase
LLALNARLRVWVAAEPADFRCGIDGLARRVRQKLAEDPFSGGVFVFCNRRRTAVKLLVYDGQGFWLCQKRLSQGHYRFWPQESPGKRLAPHALAVLLSGGDYAAAGGIPEWRAVA